ncbi:hypothetical protein ACH4ZX_28095 [Streptomyces sp. NPDC020490]|uniref:hypothetical protein n=1 Tax=Streptomyces sp. NPDC020490 TaxID=3365078 RepID=UPI0037B24C9D
MIELHPKRGGAGWWNEVRQTVEATMCPRKADPSPLRIPHRKRWYTITVLFALLSVLIAPWWIGQHHQYWEKSPQSWDWSPLPDLLTQWIGGLGLLLSGGNTPQVWGIRAAYLIVLGFTLWAWRRAMLHRTAYKPGAVQVEDLVAAVTPDVQPQPLTKDLTAQFRKQLSETELYAPTNLPAEAPAESYLDLLGEVNVEPQKLVTSLLRFISRLRPRLAYRISGVLAVREGEPRYGITATVTSYAIPGSRAETFWEPNWEQAVRKAGYWVISALLPITSPSKRQPWREWRGRNLPLDLFTAYQKARELSSERRFDEILDCYYQAARQDPLNVYLRNQIGATQEKLGLHLDALETYYGAINVGSQGTETDNKRLLASLWNLRRFAHLWFLRDQPGVLQSRYRFAVVLGTSEQTATQWCKVGSDARSTARKQIRKALTPAFAARYSDLVKDLAVGEPRAWLESILGEIPGDGEERRRRKQEITLIFQRAGFLEMCKLIEDYRIARFILRFRSDETALTRSALRVNRDVWAPLRLAQAQEELGKSREQILEWETHRPWWRRRWRPGVERAAKRVATTPDADTLKKQLRKALRYSIYSPRERIHPREWQGHYNAACAYAVALKLNRTTRNENTRRKLAEHSCHELKEALRRAKEGYLSLRRSWLLYEDPDLARLRTTSEFVRFAREFYPHPSPDVLPISVTSRDTEVIEPAHGEDQKELEATDVEMTAYDRSFLEAVGNTMERVWHHRSAKAAADVHTMRSWFESEKQIWELIDIISAGEARNWRNRRRLLQKVEETADSTVRPRIELPTSVPEFDEIITLELEHDEWVYPDRMRNLRDHLPERLDKKLRWLHGHVREASGHSPIKRSSDLLAAVERLDSSGLDSLHKVTLGLICAKYAAAWQAFSSQFSPLIDPAKPGLDFPEALDQLSKAIPVVAWGS